MYSFDSTMVEARKGRGCQKGSVGLKKGKQCGNRAIVNVRANRQYVQQAGAQGVCAFTVPSSDSAAGVAATGPSLVAGVGP